MPAVPPTPPDPPAPSSRTLGKSLAALGLGALSLVYLLNPGAGIIDLIPDNLPILGNLDEAAATLILLNCLAYLGLDLRSLAGRRHRDPVSEAKNVTPPGGFGR